MHRLRELLPLPHTTRERWGATGLGVVYFLATGVSAVLHQGLAVINPAAGIGLGVLTLEGSSLWPGIYLGSLAWYVYNGSAPVYIIILPIAHTLQALVGTYVLRKLSFDPLLRRLRDMFAMMGVAIFGSIIVPALGTAGIWVTRAWFDPSFPAAVTFGSWWTGVMMSLLILAPLIIRWGAEPLFKRSPRQIVELVLVFAALLSIDWALLWVGISSINGVSLVYVMLLPFFWLAIRIGPRFTILALFLTTCLAIGATMYGPHAITDPTALGNRLFQIEIFMDIIAIIFYVIAALQEERVEATKSLTSYIDKLEEALNRLSLQDRAKSDFIAILAHELRNPLAPIVSALEFLRLGPPRPPEETETLELMDDRLRTVQRLLDDLLDVSRIERSKIELQREAVDLRTVLERSIRSVGSRIEGRRQELQIEVPGEPLMLFADPVRIEQVISNLLTNACKFTPEGGGIFVSAAREGDAAVVRVRDTGIGIEPAMLERIFEPFLQLETGERRGDGLGIGLSLTKRLVEMHAGQIEVMSEGTGSGSEFILRFPLADAMMPPAAPAPAVQQAPVSSTLARVLVVDDNAAAGRGIGKLLTLKGYDVEYAHSGAQTRDMLALQKPQAIVLDIGLPDTDGYTLARLLRVQDGYKGALLALTGYGQQEDKDRALEAGFDAHLTKPVGIDELVAAINRAIAGGEHGTMEA
ncbi:MAG TPA: ATP-binding protein [Candidatus Paceibacterota bacterium]|nr:ATP-binding protein [Candidatus Paceibacterota bacterium]